MTPRRATIAAGLLALSGCTTARPCKLGHAAIAAELLFGLSRPAGGPVSPAAFDAFVTDAIVPRFPAGTTVLAGAGTWRGPDGRVVHEGARVVLISAPDEAATLARLDEVRAAYRARFAQQSVGLIISQSCAGF